MERLSPEARKHLDKRLDYDNGGIDTDLLGIALSIPPNWESSLAVPLGLTAAESADIKHKNLQDLSLQRYIYHNIIMRNVKASNRTIFSCFLHYLALMPRGTGGNKGLRVVGHKYNGMQLKLTTKLLTRTE